MAATKKMDLLTAMEQIVEKAKGSKLGAEFYREANIYIGYVAERLCANHAEPFVVIVFVCYCTNSFSTLPSLYFTMFTPLVGAVNGLPFMS